MEYRVVHILHLALGGCLKAPPVAYGVTTDTGGHIAYVLEAALNQSRLPEVGQVTIVTRLFDDPGLDPVHAQERELVAPKLVIERIATRSAAYLEKEDLGAQLPSFIEAFCAKLRSAPSLPTGIHAHFADAAMVAIEAQRRFGIPFVYTPHSLGMDKLSHDRTSPTLAARIEAERQALRAASSIIVSSREELTRQVAAYGVDVGGRVHVLPPGAPQHRGTSARSTIAAQLGVQLVDPHRPIVLAIARPVAKKNLAILLKAFARSPDLRAVANLVILAGQHDFASGEERGVLAELHSLAELPDLSGCVALPPAHSADDVAALYARAANGGVFANTALHEPFGLTILEAAAAGAPVLATANGGAAEIVADIGHGVVVDPTDVDAIARALLKLVSNRPFRATLVSAARSHRDRYCWTRFARESLAIYRDLVVPRLLVCDIDGTLTGDALAAARFTRWHGERVLPFVVATGRSFDDARRVLRSWSLPEPAAFITDVGTRLIVSDGDGGWRDHGTFLDELDRNWDRVAVAAVLAKLKVLPQPSKTAGPHKLSFFGDAAAAARIRTALDEAGLNGRVVFSHGRFIDVLAPNAGKAAAIAAYARLQRHGLSHCVAAGDSGNDADMLAACGHAIVVGNAHLDLASLSERPGLYRARQSHAAGVLEGLEAIGVGLRNDALKVAA